MKLLLKYLLSVIFAIILALLILFGSACLYETYYARPYATEEILYITNNSYIYLALFIIAFTVIMIKTYFPKIFFIGSIEPDTELNRSRWEIFIEHFNDFIKKHRHPILVLGIVFIVIVLYISAQSYTVLYESHFIKHHLFHEEKTYIITDVESFTVEMAGLFNRQGYSMKLHMEDGEDVELFGHIEITTSAFDKKYSTYGYKVAINNQLLDLGVKKNIRDKALILKECESYDEPYRSDVRILVGE